MAGARRWAIGKDEGFAADAVYRAIGRGSDPDTNQSHPMNGFIPKGYIPVRLVLFARPFRREKLTAEAEQCIAPGSGAMAGRAGATPVMATPHRNRQSFRP